VICGRVFAGSTGFLEGFDTRGAQAAVDRAPLLTTPLIPTASIREKNSLRENRHLVIVVAHQL
jgi:hypothetical protein